MGIAAEHADEAVANGQFLHGKGVRIEPGEAMAVIFHCAR